MGLLRIKKLKSFFFGALFLTLSACAGSEKDEPVHLVFVEKPVESIYNQALDALNAGNYRMAALLFDEVERQHPYSTWARRAMLFSAYSYYEANKYAEAINATDRFIKLHPGNKHVAYAYYLKSVCYYEQITDVGRDQDSTRRASEALREVMRRFPRTEYARDAQLKLDMTRDHLAGKEMAIGRFYQKDHNYIAAINRFRNVLRDYQTTSHTPEALHRLTETYLALGVDTEAQSAAAVLGYNYPGNKWYQRSYDLLQTKDLKPKVDEGSWMSRAVKAIL
jgi:outer membrane protein assembly factor BamD